jgi:hypothetical protein
VKTPVKTKFLEKKFLVPQKSLRIKKKHALKPEHVTVLLFGKNNAVKPAVVLCAEL